MGGKREGVVSVGIKKSKREGEVSVKGRCEVANLKWVFC